MTTPPRAALFGVSALLLLTMGGAVFASPITLPLIYRTIRSRPAVGWRWVGGVIGALTAAEVAWAVTYVVAGEVTPWIWALPAAVALAVGTAFVVAGRATSPA